MSKDSQKTNKFYIYHILKLDPFLQIS
jgi:hypothetical protein